MSKKKIKVKVSLRSIFAPFYIGDRIYERGDTFLADPENILIKKLLEQGELVGTAKKKKAKSK